jgi:hypothetical protein
MRTCIAVIAAGAAAVAAPAAVLGATAVAAPAAALVAAAGSALRETAE